MLLGVGQFLYGSHMQHMPAWTINILQDVPYVILLSATASLPTIHGYTYLSYFWGDNQCVIFYVSGLDRNRIGKLYYYGEAFNHRGYYSRHPVQHNTYTHAIIIIMQSLG